MLVKDTLDTVETWMLKGMSEDTDGEQMIRKRI